MLDKSPHLAGNGDSAIIIYRTSFMLRSSTHLTAVLMR